MTIEVFIACHCQLRMCRWLFEFTPAEMKHAIVGLAAPKTQVQHMVKILLRLDVTPPFDAADGVECHGHTRSTPLRCQRMDLKRWA